MELTNKQKKGLKIAVERYKNKDKYTVISGYAGVGKTTLVSHIIKELNLLDSEVCFAAFTGKATQVLLKKGNKNVSTLHKLLYESIPKADGTFIRKKVKRLDYKLVIVDEVSQVPKEMIDLLFSHRPHVICLGDPFQLPPINKDEDNHLLDNPHIFLDEIMRQEEDSEIIQLSMAIREGKSLKYFKGNDIVIAPKKDLNTGMLQWADQIICATNKTRQDINTQSRLLLGKSGMPQEGDKIICTRNYWDICDTDKNPLVNGTIGYIENGFNNFVKLPKFVGGQEVDLLCCNLRTDELTTFNGLEIDKDMITTGFPTVDAKTAYRINKSKWKGTLPSEFLYAYAITCHKAQGSEWERVMVIEEGFPYNREEHARWLYTAVTRASDKLLLIK